MNEFKKPLIQVNAGMVAFTAVSGSRPSSDSVLTKFVVSLERLRQASYSLDVYHGTTTVTVTMYEGARFPTEFTIPIIMVDDADTILDFAPGLFDELDFFTPIPAQGDGFSRPSKDRPHVRRLFLGTELRCHERVRHSADEPITGFSLYIAGKSHATSFQLSEEIIEQQKKFIAARPAHLYRYQAYQLAFKAIDEMWSDWRLENDIVYPRITAFHYMAVMPGITL